MQAAPRAARRNGAPPRWLGRAPDLLTALRVLLAPVFVLALPRRPEIAFAAAVLAAATDFADGRLARRLGGGSRRGAVLDVAADAVFVLAAFAALAAAGAITVALPVATAVSLAAFARSWRRRGAPAEGPRRLPDRVGHAAGVVNYAILLLGSGAIAFSLPLPVRALSFAAAALNVLPLLLRPLWREGGGSSPSDRFPRSAA